MERQGRGFVAAPLPARTPGAPPPKDVSSSLRCGVALRTAEAVSPGSTRDWSKSTRRCAQPGLFARNSAKAAALAKARADHVAALAKAEEDWLEASTALEAAGSG